MVEIIVIIISPQNERFWGIFVLQGILESASLSVHLSICVQNTSFCQSTSTGIESHLVTALAYNIDIYFKPRLIVNNPKWYLYSRVDNLQNIF